MAVAGESIILQGLATPTTDLMAVAGESIIFQGLSTPTTDLMAVAGEGIILQGLAALGHAPLVTVHAKHEWGSPKQCSTHYSAVIRTQLIGM